MAKISRLSLHIINTAKKRRLIIGRSAKAFGRQIEKSEEYVQNIESVRSGHYLQFDYALIASALDWETHDLLPPDNTPYSDGTLVEKVVFSLSNPADAEEVLVGMKENKYFDSLKSINDIYDHLYLPDSKAMAVKRQIISDVLTNLVKDGLLKLDKGRYTA